MREAEEVRRLGHTRMRRIGGEHPRTRVAVGGQPQPEQVAFATAAGLVHQLQEARDERRLLRLQQNLAAAKLLIVNELGYVPLSQTGAELLFEIFSQRHERSSTIVTSNLPFEEWTSVFGSERLIGALLDRLTHHVHILEMNGESYRLKHSKARRRQQLAQDASRVVDPHTGEIRDP